MNSKQNRQLIVQLMIRKEFSFENMFSFLLFLLVISRLVHCEELFIDVQISERISSKVSYQLPPNQDLLLSIEVQTKGQAIQLQISDDVKGDDVIEHGQIYFDSNVEK